MFVSKLTKPALEINVESETFVTRGFLMRAFDRHYQGKHQYSDPHCTGNGTDWRD